MTTEITIKVTTYTGDECKFEIYEDDKQVAEYISVENDALGWITEKDTIEETRKLIDKISLYLPPNPTVIGKVDGKYYFIGGEDQC